MARTKIRVQAVGLELPAVYLAADRASLVGQRTYLALSGARLLALLVGIVAGALLFLKLAFDVFGLLMLIAFVVAAISEFTLIRFQPERDWYSGRAIAESTKTLAWRFSVMGEPFGPSLPMADAEALLRTRITEVVSKGKDRIHIGLGNAVVTEEMRTLRKATLRARRAAYLTYRTGYQRKWYSDKAKANETHATWLRFGLLAVELVAVTVAAVTLGRHGQLDIASVLAGLIAAGAGWLALKQYSQLTSAYRVAATELALQDSVLETVAASEWPQAVADAEEAISREHTMWLASRGRETV